MSHFVMGDFNSHNALWGYTSTDNDGEAVGLWAKTNNLLLIHNAKLTKSFNSAIWKKGYNPDLIFASSNLSNMCEKSVLDPIHHTQHRPIWLSVNPVIVAQPTTFRRRFNMKKADWEGFSADLDSNIEEVDDIPTVRRNATYGIEKNTYQEGVGQTTFLVTQTNQIIRSLQETVFN